MRTCLGVVVLGCAFAASARADVTTLTLSSNNFDIVAGTPVSHTASGAPAFTNLLGFSLASGNWTSLTGDAWSNELEVGFTTPGGTIIPVGGPIGGVGNANPYAYPGGSFGTSGIVFGTVATGTGGGGAGTGIAPANTTAGTYTFTFDHAFANSSANLAHPTAITLTAYSNPTSATGTTTGAPTATRANENGTTAGTALIPFSTHTVTVSTTGRYMLAMSSPTVGYDTFLTLYGPGGYTPGTPLTNLIATSDDGNLGVSSSVITIDLTAGTNYTAVITGFNATDFGDYTIFGAGAGVVTFNPVPEPATVFGIGAAAMGLVGLVRKRRKAAPQPVPAV